MPPPLHPYHLTFGFMVGTSAVTVIHLVPSPHCPEGDGRVDFLWFTSQHTHCILSFRATRALRMMTHVPRLFETALSSHPCELSWTEHLTASHRDSSLQDTAPPLPLACPVGPTVPECQALLLCRKSLAVTGAHRPGGEGTRLGDSVHLHSWWPAGQEQFKVETACVPMLAVFPCRSLAWACAPSSGE